MAYAITASSPSSLFPCDYFMIPPRCHPLMPFVLCSSSLPVISYVYLQVVVRPTIIIILLPNCCRLLLKLGEFLHILVLWGFPLDMWCFYTSSYQLLEHLHILFCCCFEAERLLLLLYSICLAASDYYIKSSSFVFCFTIVYPSPLHILSSSMPCMSTKFIAKSATFIFFFGFAMICGNPSLSSRLMHLCHLAFSYPSCYISSPSGLLSHQHDSTTACRLADMVYLYSHLARFGTSLISSGSKSPKQLSCGGDHLLHRQVQELHALMSSLILDFGCIISFFC